MKQSTKLLSLVLALIGIEDLSEPALNGDFSVLSGLNPIARR